MLNILSNWIIFRTDVFFRITIRYKPIIFCFFILNRMSGYHLIGLVHILTSTHANGSRDWQIEGKPNKRTKRKKLNSSEQEWEKALPYFCVGTKQLVGSSNERSSNSGRNFPKTLGFWLERKRYSIFINKLDILLSINNGSCWVDHQNTEHVWVREGGV